MNFGKLNKRLVLKSVTRVTDNLGGFTESEVTKKTTWGSLEPLSQRELLLYGMEAGQKSYRCLLRWDENYDIDQNYFIEWTDRFNNTRIFRIVSVIDFDEAARILSLFINERNE